MGIDAVLASRLPLDGIVREASRTEQQCVSSTSLSDEELACRAQRGCADSFEQLMRRFQTPLLHFLQRRGEFAEAEDLLQETFLKAHLNLFRYRSQWRFATWIFTIARRVSITFYRRPRLSENSQAAIASAESRFPGPAETAMKEDSRRYLWARASQILSEKETTALWLLYGENMHTREIASVLGCSRIVVKTMLFRARKKLAPLLEDLIPDNAASESGDLQNIEERAGRTKD